MEFDRISIPTDLYFYKKMVQLFKNVGHLGCDDLNIHPIDGSYSLNEFFMNLDVNITKKIPCRSRDMAKKAKSKF